MTITFALEMLLSFHDGMMNTYPMEVVVDNLPSQQAEVELLNKV